jgi:hypothetical protein
MLEPFQQPRDNGIMGWSLYTGKEQRTAMGLRELGKSPTVRKDAQNPLPYKVVWQQMTACHDLWATRRPILCSSWIKSQELTCWLLWTAH